MDDPILRSRQLVEMTAHTLAESRHQAATFFLADMELATTLLAAAEGGSEQKREHAMGVATEACATVERLLPRTTLEPGQEAVVLERLKELHARMGR